MTPQDTHCWRENIDKGLVTWVVFIDLHKAFVTGDLDILLVKVPKFCVEGIKHQWFWSYLTGRVQSVTVDGRLPNPLPVSIGIPQALLFFLLFLNDFPTIHQSRETTMYADDTEYEAASKPEDYKELETTINNNLHRINEYFETNKLNHNVPECEFMLVGTYPSLAKVPNIIMHINNEPLKQVTVSKYLGMKIHSNLKWDDHINAIIHKI